MRPHAGPVDHFPLSLYLFLSSHFHLSSGVFALLNDLQLQKGKPTLGFLNPWIYQNMAAFTDITEGSNEGCLGSSGFPAEPGYDAVTGCGSPNYVKMAAALP